MNSPLFPSLSHQWFISIEIHSRRVIIYDQDSLKISEQNLHFFFLFPNRSVKYQTIYFKNGDLATLIFHLGITSFVLTWQLTPSVRTAWYAVPRRLLSEEGRLPDKRSLPWVQEQEVPVVLPIFTDPEPSSAICQLCELW